MRAVFSLFTDFLLLVGCGKNHDKVEVKDIDIKVEDVELVVETIVKKVKLEIKENV